MELDFLNPRTQYQDLVERNVENLSQRNEFLFLNNGFEQYKQPLEQHGGRWYTFKTALNLLKQLVPKPRILETGCVRLKDDYGAGYSTVIFADFLDYWSKLGGELVSVDISSLNILTAQSILMTQHHTSRAQVSLVKAHSVQYLASLVEENTQAGYQKNYFDLIYLDSQDYDPVNFEATFAAQEHQSEEAFYSLHLEPKIILLDDNDQEAGGKTLLSKQRILDTDRYLLLYEGRQSLWLKK